MTPNTTQVIEEFPLRTHRYLAVSILLAILAMAGLLAGWYYLVLPTYQRQYLGTYVASSAGAAFLPHFGRGPSRFRVKRDLLSYEHAPGLESWRVHYHIRDYPPVFDKPVLAILMPPISASILALMAGIIVGSIMDLNYVRALRRGLVKRGPRRITVDEYNRQTRGDGIAFLVENEPKA